MASLNTAIRTALQDPQVLERFKMLNVEAAPATPEAFAERIRKERERWAPVVRASGFKMDS